jgi:hypothetical protein
MANQGIEISSGAHEARGSKRIDRILETLELLHTGPLVTTVQAKATFVPPTAHLAFDKAIGRAASRVKRGEAELPLTLTLTDISYQLVELGKGGRHGAHKVRQILSPF